MYLFLALFIHQAISGMRIAGNLKPTSGFGAGVGDLYQEIGLGRLPTFLNLKLKVVDP